MQKVDLRNFEYDELVEFVADEFGVRPFHARQIFDWIYRKGASEFSQMTNLSKDLRAKLDERCTIEPLSITKVLRSKDGTEKLQIGLHDGETVEAVLIPADDRITLCISSQVGCAMGCAFCFTGSLKLTRNLSAAEIVDQYRQALAHIGGDDSRISNVVMMGMGEPLANLDNVVRACNLLMDDRGYNLASRKVTVSTCGLVPRIGELMRRSLVSLAVSLNATTDEVRSRIMPVNRKYPIAELLDALQAYPKQRRKRIFLEYVMLAGINDTAEDAKRLKKIANRLGSKVNLIPFNPHEAGEFDRPSDEKVLAFQKILLDGGVTVFIRQSRGLDVYGACGMLGKGKKGKAKG